MGRRTDGVALQECRLGWLFLHRWARSYRTSAHIRVSASATSRLQRASDSCNASNGQGVNRYGLSFHKALLSAIGWTPEEFEMVFDIWVQQSVTGTCIHHVLQQSNSKRSPGPQNEEERAFAVLATRALFSMFRVLPVTPRADGCSRIP